MESGDDPMRVTSQVVGGFVVIDASVSEVEKEVCMCLFLNICV